MKRFINYFINNVQDVLKIKIRKKIQLYIYIFNLSIIKKILFLIYIIRLFLNVDLKYDYIFYKKKVKTQMTVRVYDLNKIDKVKYLQAIKANFIHDIDNKNEFK